MHLARTERAGLLALLTDLAPHQREDPTLCRLAVRDVVAYISDAKGSSRPASRSSATPTSLTHPGLNLPFANRRSSSRRQSPFAGRSKQACSDARGAVGAVAVAEGDLAQQEMLFELAPLVAGSSALLGAVAQLAAVLDERFVGGDEVLGGTQPLATSDIRTI
jgi:hypothetical protein